MSLKDFKDKVLNYNDSDPTTERNEHYKKSKIQPWDVIDDHELNFYLGNAIKYVLRAGKIYLKIYLIIVCLISY